MVFDKTGTMTQGVFEVAGIHHCKIEDQKLLEYAALAEIASSHPISRSLQKAYGGELDRSRVTDIEEIGGNGVTAVVDGIPVAVGNGKLMDRLGIPYTPCQECRNRGPCGAGWGLQPGIFSSPTGSSPMPKRQSEALNKAGITKTVMLTGDGKAAGRAGGKGAGH